MYCIICTGLGVLNWTGVMYVLDWGLVYRNIVCTVVCARLVCCMRGGGKGVKHCLCTCIKAVGSTRHRYTSSEF